MYPNTLPRNWGSGDCSFGLSSFGAVVASVFHNRLFSVSRQPGFVEFDAEDEKFVPYKTPFWENTPFCGGARCAIMLSDIKMESDRYENY